MRITSDKIALLSNDANEFFGNFVSMDGDSSLAGFLRAIVIKYSGADVKDFSRLSALMHKRVRSEVDMQCALSDAYEGSTTIAVCTGCFENEISMDGWASSITIDGKPFPVNTYLSQFGKTKIYINESQKAIVAFVDKRVSHVWIQAFESVLCRLMPWYFPTKLPEEEVNFVTAIAVDNKNENAERIFLEYVDAAYKMMDFRSLRLHHMLDGIADRLRKSEMTRLTSKIADTRRGINDYYERVVAYRTQLDKDVLALKALELTPPTEDSAMYDFFFSHKQLSLHDVDDSYLKFSVDDTLEFYDEDELKRIIKNRGSYINSYNKETVEIIKAIFLERRGIVRTTAAFVLDNMRYVNSRKGEKYIEDAMPQPHIFWYGCNGGNGQYYTEYGDKGEWDMGIEQAIAATKNLNWGDSTVCRRMLSWIQDNPHNRWIYVNDGSPMDGVTPESKLVSLEEFKKLLAKLKESENADG